MTHENKKVIGLAYNPNGDKKALPRIVVKGTGQKAHYIKKEFGKLKPAHRLVQNEELVDKLFRLPTDSEISSDLYELVAILLVHVYSVEANLKGIVE